MIRIITASIDYVYYYTYDANDKVTKTEFDLYNDGTIDSVINYTYDADGNKLTEEHDNNLDGTTRHSLLLHIRCKRQLDSSCI